MQPSPSRANQTVQVGKVQQVGHDDSQPAGSQDTFMLDDATLAWGQATNPTDGGQITVTKTQTLPGVGPTDNGKSLIDLAAASEPHDGSKIGALIRPVGIGLLSLGVVFGALLGDATEPGRPKGEQNRIRARRSARRVRAMFTIPPRGSANTTAPVGIWRYPPTHPSGQHRPCPQVRVGLTPSPRGSLHLAETGDSAGHA